VVQPQARLREKKQAPKKVKKRTKFSLRGGNGEKGNMDWETRRPSTRWVVVNGGQPKKPIRGEEGKKNTVREKRLRMFLKGGAEERQN